MVECPPPRAGDAYSCTISRALDPGQTMDDETMSYDGRSRLRAIIIRLTDHLPRDLGLQRGVDTMVHVESHVERGVMVIQRLIT